MPISAIAIVWEEAKAPLALRKVSGMHWLAVTEKVIKVAATPVVTLTIALVGWIITTRYNATQRRIAEAKNKADLEIAKVNSSMQFLQYYEKIPETELEKRSNAIAISIPILPPDLAFDMAVGQVEHDTGAMQALFGRYENESFCYIERHLARGPLFRTAEFVQDVEFDPRTDKLFEVLFSGKLDAGIDYYLFFSDVRSANLRANAIVNYFRFLRYRSDQSKNESLGFIRYINLTNRLLEDPKVRPEVKHTVALASCIAFLHGYGDDRDELVLDRAASYFWDGLDVAGGEIPREDSLEGFVYRHAFYYRNPANSITVALPVRDRLSSELLERLKRLERFYELPWQNVRLILYSYTQHTPRDTESPFVSFLAPGDALDLYKVVLGWANTQERRRDLGQELNSLSGSVMFRNFDRSPDAQRAWAELTITFYESYYSRDWYDAKIAEEIAQKFPEFSPRIAQRHWGIPSAR